MNNDNWLKYKKGYVFMPENERKEILEALVGVDEVFVSEHAPNTSDISICEALKKIRPHIFAKGGDRNTGNIPEVAVCAEINCQIVNNVGAGGKVQSSSWLIAKAADARTKKKTKK